MQTEKVRLRRTFTPLTAATSIICLTERSSPTTQVYDAIHATYEPDRGGTADGIGSPCLLRPVIELHAEDGSMPDTIGNRRLAQMKWLVNGRDITTVAEWQNAYSIDDSASDSRGTITIYRNVPIGECCELSFQAVVNDPRTNVNVPVTAGPATLRTTDKSEDQWNISLLADSTYTYDPLLDRLMLYNYRVAHGLTAGSSTAELAADDLSSYRLKMNVEVRKGKTLQDSTAYSLELYRVNQSTGALTRIQPLSVSAGSISELSEVRALTSNYVGIDMRLIDREQYLVIARADGIERARAAFAVRRTRGQYTLAPTNAAGVAPSDTVRRDIVKCTYHHQVLQNPECAISIIWRTKAPSYSAITHNEGEQTAYNLGQAGLGDEYTSNQIDQWVESEQKPRMTVATDDDGAVFCDSSGLPYIFN